MTDKGKSNGESKNLKPRPKGEPQGVARLRDMIEATLVEMGGGYAVDSNGSYVLGLESARVFVVPAWLEDETTVARVFAVTNLGVPVTAELTSYLLAKNLEFVFGGFALDVDEGAVWFNHNLLGEHMTPAELEATVGAVASTADQYDDEIKSRFGGRLYIESPEQSIPAPTMPGYL
ncbi:MAG TPA: YbjN domain-containing protein [Actinomycetota bacterium]|nr:YbjN domain-containing protein [Actinomycetota bacterium]